MGCGEESTLRVQPGLVVEVWKREHESTSGKGPAGRCGVEASRRKKWLLAVPIRRIRVSPEASHAPGPDRVLVRYDDEGAGTGRLIR